MVNLKNNDNEFFRLCHILYLNPQENNPQKILKSDREVLVELDYEGIEFPVAVKDYSKLEWKNTININVMAMKTNNFTLFTCPKSVMRMF